MNSSQRGIPGQDRGREPPASRRVLLLSHLFPPDGIAGVERVSETMAAHLVEAGDVVSVASRRPNPASSSIDTVVDTLPDGTRVYRLAGGLVRLDDVLTDSARLEELFETIVRDVRPDVLHVNHLLGLSPRMIELARRQGIAVVVALYDFYFSCPLVNLRKRSGGLCDGPDGGRECARTCFAHEGAAAQTRWRLRDAYFRRVLALADRVICPSRCIASHFEPFVDEPRRMSIIPVGVSRAGAEPAPELYRGPRKRGHLSLAYLGSVVPLKGPDLILDALKLADLGPVEVVMIGQVPEWTYARSLRERAATIPNVRLRLYGRYEHAELPHLLDDADCVVLPSRVPESFSIVTREAFLHGVPVIASRLGALAEAISEGENGFTFEAGRADQLAARLGLLAADEALVSRLREGARTTPVTSVAQSTAAVRAVHAEAMLDRARSGTAVDQLRALEAAMFEAGFAGAR